MRGFEYVSPGSLAEAVTVLAGLSGRAKPLAGGTDLLVQVKDGKARPEVVVNVKGLPELAGIEAKPGGGLRVGAVVTVAALAASREMAEAYPALAQAARQLASPAVRNRATVGGNLCNASPAADLAPPLLAYGAVACLAGPDGSRRLPLEDFFRGPGQTALQAGEILEAVELPPPAARTGAVYLKHGVRRAHEIAIVGVAALVRLAPGAETVEQTRLALGAVAPTPMRAVAAEEWVHGKVVDEQVALEAARLAAGAANPISDVRASAAYRRRMVAVLSARALVAAAEAARGEGGK